MAIVEIIGNQAQVEFSTFGLDSYELFLKCKKLPESSLEYDWRSDTYKLTAPARYARMLGVADAPTPDGDLNLASHLFDYQNAIVRKALEAKRYAIYADCGLGKTMMFLEFGLHVIARGGKVLILSPLQVIPQTIEEYSRWYPKRVQMLHLKTRDELTDWLKSVFDTPFAICNYEKLIDGQMPELRHLTGLILDESSILKSGGGVIKWNLIKSAKGIEYKLSCTATPAPNDIMEYASQAAFLEKLRHEGEILWTFFSRDKRGNWKIKPHARQGFYRFMASFSIYLRNPAHYGWKDNNVDSIPAPVFHEDRIEMTAEQRKEAGKLFHTTGAGLFGDKRMGIRERSKLSQLAKGFLYGMESGKTNERGDSGGEEKKLFFSESSCTRSKCDVDGGSIDATASRGNGRNDKAQRRKVHAKARSVKEIPSHKPWLIHGLTGRCTQAGRQVLIWTVFDEESSILGKIITPQVPQTAVLTGKTKDSERLRIVDAFRRGEIPVLISKPSLLGFGLNFQNCGAMIFSGWDDSYERFYQAIRRAYRYGQTKRLQVHIPFIPELEGMILENVMRKKDNFERDAEMQERYYREALEGLV